MEEMRKTWKLHKDEGRARTLMTKCWLAMWSRGTKNMNLEEDLEDIQSTAREWAGAKKRKQQGCGRKVTISEHRSPENQPKMEGIVYFVDR